MAVVLDAGALIAVERRDASVGALLRVAQRDRVPVRTSAAVIAQVWRDGASQAQLARVLAGLEVRPLDESSGRSIGELLGRTRKIDVVDGHVALLAQAGDTVLTSDVEDLKSMLEARRVSARVRRVLTGAMEPPGPGPPARQRSRLHSRDAWPRDRDTSSWFPLNADSPRLSV